MKRDVTVTKNNIMEHSSTIYFPYGELFCKIYVYNFLYRNYNIENVQIRIKYFELDGTFLEEELVMLDDDASLILDSKKMPFKRDMVIELSLENSCAIRGILRAFADYYNKNVITSVHEQGAYWDSSKDIVAQGNIPLLATNEIKLYLLIQNTHTTKKSISFNIRIYNYKGESIIVQGKKLSYREFCKVKVTNKKIIKFLDGKDGHVCIEYDSYIGRAAYIYLTKKVDYASISHAAYWAFDKRPHTALDYYTDDKNTIQAFVFLAEYKGFNSKVTLYNDYKEKEYFDVEVYDSSGVCIKQFTKIVVLKSHQTFSITPEVLKLQNFKGSIKIIAYFENSNPLYVNANYIMEYNNYRADSAIEFIPYLNVDKAKNMLKTTIVTTGTFHRSRQFCRAINNKKFESYLLLSFSSVDNLRIRTKVKISFISLDGQYSITKYIFLKLNQSIFEKISKFLSKKELSCLGSYFSVYIRNQQHKVSSFVLVKNKKTNAIGMDHFVGA